MPNVVFVEQPPPFVEGNEKFDERNTNFVENSFVMWVALSLMCLTLFLLNKHHYFFERIEELIEKNINYVEK